MSEKTSDNSEQDSLPESEDELSEDELTDIELDEASGGRGAVEFIESPGFHFRIKPEGIQRE